MKAFLLAIILAVALSVAPGFAADYEVAAQTLADARLKVEALLRKFAQKVANQVPFLMALKNEVDPDVDALAFQKLWDAACRGEYTASSQGSTIHALLAKELHGKTVKVSFLENGVRKTETWLCLTEVQLLENKGWFHKVGRILGMGAIARESGVKVADLIFLEGFAKPSKVSTSLGDMAASWRGGLDFKSVYGKRVAPRLDARLIAVLEESLGENMAKLYIPCRIVRCGEVAAFDRPLLTRLLQRQTGKPVAWCREQALRIGSRGFKTMLVGMGVFGAAAAVVEAREAADKITAESERIVRLAYSDRSPELSDTAVLAALIMGAWGKHVTSGDDNVVMGQLYRALMVVHAGFSEKAREERAVPTLDDFVDGKPFVEVDGEYYPRYSEPRP